MKMPDPVQIANIVLTPQHDPQYHPPRPSLHMAQHGSMSCSLEPKDALKLQLFLAEFRSWTLLLSRGNR